VNVVVRITAKAAVLAKTAVVAAKSNLQ